jgi:hypothetical protein
MSIITGTLDLSEIPDQSFDPTLRLRAAVVYDGMVLGSTTLAPQTAKQQLPFSVTFRAPFLPGATRPCVVRLIIGPDVPDLDLPNLSTLSVEVELDRLDVPQADAKPDATVQQDNFQVSVGVIRITPALYDLFRFSCATYTIRGRVVCRNIRYDSATGGYFVSDDPVPGATVEAYNVHNLLASFHISLVNSDVTDVNGFFMLTFTSCCLARRPWPKGYWFLDPEVLAHIRDVFSRAGVPVPRIPVGPDPDPWYFRQLVDDATFGGSAALTAGTSTLAAPLSAEVLRSLLPPSLELETMRIWPWFESDGCAPNIKFRVTQMCGNELREIRVESNLQTRFDIPRSLEVTLVANDLACCLPDHREPECPGCMKVTYVNCVPSDRIGGADAPPSLRGYANIAVTRDEYFHGVLPIRGAMDLNVDYFKVQIRPDSPSEAWRDLNEGEFQGFPRAYWGPPQTPVDFKPTPKSGQLVMITRKHYEELHPELPRPGGEVIWFDYDTLFHFRTGSGATPDGLYELRFLGYTADSADNLILNSERILTTCGEQGNESVFIRIDNQTLVHTITGHPCSTRGGVLHTCTDEPECYIREIRINEGTDSERLVKACDMASMTANDTMTIHFTASVPRTRQDGHLGSYSLLAQYGEAASFNLGASGIFQPDPTFEVGPDYASALTQGAPRPNWYGGDFKITLRGSAFPLSCAYTFLLQAWKRNACSGSHGNRYARSITILRTDLPATTTTA